jgi:DNA-binding transcriptional LysR family regulator
MVIGCAITPLFIAMEKFHRDHPGVELTVQEGNSTEMVESVRGGELDVALIGAAGAPPDGVGSMTIVSEGLAALVPPGHRLARRRRVHVDDLAVEPIVSMPTGTGIRSTLDIGCAAAGFAPNIVIAASAADTVADLAERGLGVGVLSASMTAPYRDRLAVVPLTGIPVPALLAVVWPVTPSPAVRAFLPGLRAAFGR